MKKTIFVVALAMMLVLSMASVALAKNAGSPAINNGNSGFVDWTAAVAAVSAGNPLTTVDTVNQAFGPHANYTTTTIKCAVCHSVHGAPENSFLLTKATGGSASSAGAVCSYCHARTATASSKRVSLVMGSSTSPHSSRCAAVDGCHAQSPHGVGVSTYSLMSSKLINKKVDTLIANAIANSAKTGLTAASFQTGSTDGFKVVTGYVCGQAACHYDSAFAVKARGNSMYTNSSSGTAPVWKTGHPVIAAAGNFTPPTGSAFPTTTPKAVAWKPTDGCDTCHDVKDAGNSNLTWFPHNVPNAETAGTGAALWMTIAQDASTTPVNLPADWEADGQDYGSVLDGNCLKCHVNGNGTNGVGVDY